ncbi:unnamed protein product [Ectocarpus sp. 4 AP-2014]
MWTRNGHHAIPGGGHLGHTTATEGRQAMKMHTYRLQHSCCSGENLLPAKCQQQHDTDRGHHAINARCLTFLF